MKQKLIIVVALVLVLMAFTACRDASKQPEPTSSTTQLVADPSTEVEEATTALQASEPGTIATAEQTEKEVVTAGNSGATTTKKQPANATTPVATTTASRVPTKAPETTKPTSTTTARSFDPQVYVDYTISYGKSIGLVYRADITGSWDNPQVIGPKIPDDVSKSDIRDLLDFYKEQENFSSFNVWTENLGDGRYWLKISYA